MESNSSGRHAWHKPKYITQKASAVLVNLTAFLIYRTLLIDAPRFTTL